MKKKTGKRRTPKPEPQSKLWENFANTTKEILDRQIDRADRIVEKVDHLRRSIADLHSTITDKADRVTCFVWGTIRFEHLVAPFLGQIEGIPQEARKRIVVLNIAAAPKKLGRGEEAVFEIDPMVSALGGTLQLEGPFGFVDVQIGRSSAFMSCAPSGEDGWPCAKTIVFDEVHVGQRIQARVRRYDP
jgi:hypothetical protein